MGEVAQLLQRVVDRHRQAVENLDRPFWISVEHRPGELRLDAERHHVLLCSIVEVALDLAAGLVGGRDDPSA